jgi:hypothetical protein
MYRGRAVPWAYYQNVVTARCTLASIVVVVTRVPVDPLFHVRVAMRVHVRMRMCNMCARVCEGGVRACMRSSLCTCGGVCDLKTEKPFTNRFILCLWVPPAMWSLI